MRSALRSALRQRREHARACERRDEQGADRPVAADGEVTAGNEVRCARPGKNAEQPGPGELDHGRGWPAAITVIGGQQRDLTIADLDPCGLAVAPDIEQAGQVSWAKLSPRTIQSWARSRAGRTGKGNPYLKGLLGEAAKTSTFLGERYRRIVKRRGKLKALVAIARSILVIIWHLLANPAARYRDLGAGYYTGRIDKDRKTRNHIRQLEAPGYTVTLAPAA